MNGTLDIITLVFLVVAVVVFIRLRSVLGKRTGNERPRYDYDGLAGKDAPNNRTSRDNIVTLPRGEPMRPSDPLDEEAFNRRLKDVAPVGSEIAQKLQIIAQTDRTFDPKDFANGAKQAYEWIVTAFASGDRKVLKQLLSREVYDSFAFAMADREKKGESVEFKFVGISRSEVVEAEIIGKTIHITIKFVSELITATRNSAGDIVEGDPTQIREVTDMWTFARDMTSRDPNWRLVATGSVN
jgi:predicted lipid-binding transport protein (Tim44 family)